MRGRNAVSYQHINHLIDPGLNRKPGQILLPQLGKALQKNLETRLTGIQFAPPPIDGSTGLWLAVYFEKVATQAARLSCIAC
jgi:hypothetical protein